MSKFLPFPSHHLAMPANKLISIIIVCTDTDSAEITPLPRQTASSILECPGDIIPYRCEISSFGTNVPQLSWRVTIPGSQPLTANFNANNRDEVIHLSDHVTASVTANSSGSIHSELQLSVFLGIPTHQTMVECFNDNANANMLVLINSARKCCLLCSKIKLITTRPSL